MEYGKSAIPHKGEVHLRKTYHRHKNCTTQHYRSSHEQTRNQKQPLDGCSRDILESVMKTAEQSPYGGVPCQAHG